MSFLSFLMTPSSPRLIFHHLLFLISAIPSPHPLSGLLSFYSLSLPLFSFYPGSQLVICLVEGQTGH